MCYLVFYVYNIHFVILNLVNIEKFSIYIEITYVALQKLQVKLRDFQMQRWKSIFILLV